jgi:hypothetical protein
MEEVRRKKRDGATRRDLRWRRESRYTEDVKDRLGLHTP